MFLSLQAALMSVKTHKHIPRAETLVLYSDNHEFNFKAIMNSNRGFSEFFYCYVTTIYFYVTTISFLTLPIYYKVKSNSELFSTVSIK
jgi:hypothetical protein